MSDTTMNNVHDSFEWPDETTQKDEAAFRRWLIQVLHRIHHMSSETARLQTLSNGRVGTLEQHHAACAAKLPTLELRVTLVERLIFGGTSLLLLGVLGAMLRGVLR
jgi:hypothetical protein